MKNYFLVLKSLFIVVAFVFCCSAVYAEEIKSCKITVNQAKGKMITDVNHPHVGQLGYNEANKTESISKHGTYICKINCSGKGNLVCPKPSHDCYTLTPDVYDNINMQVCDFIDMGITRGNFLIEGLSCTWENGEKEDEVIEEEGNEVGVLIPIYSYELTIAWEEDEIIITPDLTISIFPNPVQNYLNVHFSMDIDAQMFVKIIDLEGNIRWEADMYIPGRDLQIDIPESVVPTGVYFINCTNNDYTASTSFVKQ